MANVSAKKQDSWLKYDRHTRCHPALDAFALLFVLFMWPREALAGGRLWEQLVYLGRSAHAQAVHPRLSHVFPGPSLGPPRVLHRLSSKGILF